jgi:hypothetical protein
MRRRLHATGLALGLVLLTLTAACNRKPETAQAPAPPTTPASPAPPAEPAAAPPLTGFAHEARIDSQGYYMPQGQVQVGDFRLTNLTLGAGSDFTQWEANKRMATYGPVLFEFEDIKSPVQANELGGEVHDNTLRVLPDAYRMDARGVSFRGHAKGLGDIAFDGTFDRKALDAAKAGGGSPAIVLRGDLRIGQQVFKNVPFTYFAGE